MKLLGFESFDYIEWTATAILLILILTVSVEEFIHNTKKIATSPSTVLVGFAAKPCTRRCTEQSLSSAFFSSWCCDCVSSTCARRTQKRRSGDPQSSETSACTEWAASGSAGNKSRRGVRLPRRSACGRFIESCLRAERNAERTVERRSERGWRWSTKHVDEFYGCEAMTSLQFVKPHSVPKSNIREVLDVGRW